MKNILRWISLLSALPLLFYGVWYFIDPTAFNKYIILILVTITGVSTTLATALSVKHET